MTVRSFEVTRLAYWFGQQVVPTAQQQPGAATPVFTKEGIPRGVAMAIHPMSEVRSVGIRHISGDWFELHEGMVLWLPTEPTMQLRRIFGGWTDGRLKVNVAQDAESARMMPLEIATVRSVQARALNPAQGAVDVYLDPGPFITLPTPKLTGIINDANACSARIVARWRNEDRETFDNGAVVAGTTALAATRTATGVLAGNHAWDHFGAQTIAGATSTDVDLDLQVSQGA